MTVPKAKSMRDKYGLSKIKPDGSKKFNLDILGDGDSDIGYNRLKTRCSLHGKNHDKQFVVRKNGQFAFVYRVD